MVTFLSLTLAVQSPLESGDENGIVNFSVFSNVLSLVPSIIFTCSGAIFRSNICYNN